MNDEIREIFDTKLYFDLEEEDYIKIKDYITNLQKENERLKEENKCIFSKVNDDELLISNAMNYAEAQDYKLRVEKADEYICKQKKKMYKSRNKIALFILMKLENILLNGSENE